MGQMTVTEEVYRYLEEHPDLDKITSAILHEQMAWLKKDNITSALYCFMTEGRLELIDLEIGPTGKKYSVYQFTDSFKGRKFKIKRKDGYTKEKRTKGWKRAPSKERKALIDGKRSSLVRRMERLSEIVLEVSIEIEAIKKEL